MAFDSRRGDGGGQEIARGFAMRDSTSSTVSYLPFGSLMGVVPIDSVPQGWLLAESSSVLASAGQRACKIQQKIHSVIDPYPGCTALPPSLDPSGDGGA